MQEELKQTERELKIRNYSSKTVKSYLYGLIEYFIFKKNKFDKLDTENIKNFLLFSERKGVSAQTRNLLLNANEIEKILQATENTKHKLLPALSYGTGLRVNEVINLKVEDTDLEELTIHIKQAKGKKDRISVFPEKLSVDIQSLITGKDKNALVFPSERGGRGVGGRSLPFRPPSQSVAKSVRLPAAGRDFFKYTPPSSMIVVDVETTGLDPQKHSIVSIGAVDFSNPHNQFYQECRIWDGAEVAQEALEVNGFSEEGVKDLSKNTLEEVIKEFFKWIEKLPEKTLAGQDPSFDKGFLEASAARSGIGWKLGHRTVDLHSVCYFHHLKRGLTPPSKEGRTALNLDKILNYVGLPDEPKPHNALTGARLEAEAFSRFIYGKLLLTEFKKFPVPEYLM